MYTLDKTQIISNMTPILSPSPSPPSSPTVHKAHKEELEGCLWLLGKVLCLLPELVAKRWQCHSLSRIMSKLLHTGNSHKLRREGVR